MSLPLRETEKRVFRVFSYVFPKGIWTATHHKISKIFPNGKWPFGTVFWDPKKDRKIVDFEVLSIKSTRLIKNGSGVKDFLDVIFCQLHVTIL